MNFKNYFLFSWKKLWLMIVAEVASILLHNIVSGLIGSEEALFFIIAVFIVPGYALFMGLVSLFTFWQKRLD